MRVLVLPLNYTHRQRGQVEAFIKVFGSDNVHELDWLVTHRQGYSVGDHIYDEVKRFKPDWIWIQAQGAEEFPTGSLIRIREEFPHCFLTHWMGDCRPIVPSRLAELCRVTHATLISSVGQIPLYQATGARRVEYVQIGLDPEDLGDGPEWDPPFRVPDIVFCGGYYGHVDAFAVGTQERLSAIRRLQADGFDVGVVGSGWPKDTPVIGTCTTKQSRYVYKRAKVVLSINHFNNIDRYYSDRLLIGMASGTPVLARRVPGLEEEFTHRTHCFMWETHNELIAGATTLLEDWAIMHTVFGRGSPCQAAVRHVQKHHTWEARIRQLAPKIEAWRAEDLPL
jgi:glycosyltransferase involved in cell wall biosynthesis